MRVFVCERLTGLMDGIETEFFENSSKKKRNTNCATNRLMNLLSIKYRSRAFVAIQRIPRPVVIDCMHVRNLFALVVDDGMKPLVDAQRRAIIETDIILIE